MLMYKVLIIDDEEPAREAIKILGNWESLMVSDIYEAINGSAGLALVRERKPDIVLVDMKMPEMNGLEFLQAIESAAPDLVTIVISGYNDFEYTRQAIKSKAFDYLLKPVNRHDLNQSLAKAVESIEDKRRKESEVIDRNIALNMSLPKLKEKIFISLIERTFKMLSSDYLKMIGSPGSNQRIQSIVMRIMNWEAIKENRFKNDVDSLQFAATNVINELGSGSFQCFSFMNPKREREIVAMLMTEATGNPEEMSFSSVQFSKRALFKLKDLFGIAAAAGVGTPCMNVTELADSYERAEAALNAINLLDMKETTVANGKPQAAAENRFIAGRISLIRGAFEDGDPSYAKSIVADHLKQIKQTAYFSLGDADRTLNEFMMLLDDVALDLGVSPDALPRGRIHGLNANGISFDFSRFEEYEALLLRIVEHYSELLRRHTSTASQFSIHEIKEYIDRYYYEDIKISMFTEKYFLSREYLMKLFKQQFGFGIHEYVQKVFPA